MRKRILIVGLMLLVAAIVTGCNSQCNPSHISDGQREAATLQNHTGSFSRTIEVKDGLQPVFWFSLSPQQGHISIELMDDQYNQFLSLNERATLPDAGKLTVTLPVGENSYTLDVTTTSYSGSYEVTWEFEVTMEE